MKKNLLNFVFTPLLIISVLSFIFFYSSFFPNNSVLNVNKNIKSTFFNDKKADNILVFFGYVGCVDICTPKLKEISVVYEQVKNSIDINFYFFNLTDSISGEIADLYVKNFNKDFKGVQLTKKELEILKADFDVFSVRSFLRKEELDHTSFVFLVKKNKENYTINKIFTSNKFDEKFVVNEILGY